MPPVYKRVIKKISTNFCQFFFTVASQICWLEPVTSWVSSFSTEKRICATWLWRACALWPVRNFPTKLLRRTSKLSSMHWRFCIVHNNTLYCLLSRQQMFVLLLLAYMWFISVPDWEGCECPTEGGRFAVCNVRSKQCQTDCGRDAQLSGDCRLLHQRGDGTRFSCSTLGRVAVYLSLLLLVHFSQQIICSKSDTK